MITGIASVEPSPLSSRSTSRPDLVGSARSSRIASGACLRALVRPSSPFFAVVEAKNGEEGLTKARKHAPDAILLDLALPTKSGLEVLRELKGDGSTDAIPVIIVSAYGTLMSEQDAHQAVGVIQKPFDYDDLVGQVERATDRTLA